MYDFENMDPRIIAFVNIFICSNRLQAIMDRKKAVFDTGSSVLLCNV